MRMPFMSYNIARIAGIASRAEDMKKWDRKSIDNWEALIKPIM